VRINRVFYAINIFMKESLHYWGKLRLFVDIRLYIEDYEEKRIFYGLKFLLEIHHLESFFDFLFLGY
jgi:hypothetical protein